jgi:branched-subunit amino acid transport protein
MMWIAILTSAAIAFSLRISLLMLAGGRTIPPRVDRMLAAIGPAVIAAMLTSSLLTANDDGRIDSGQLLAVIAALGVVAKTKNLLIGTGVGFVVLVVTGWLGGAGL